MQVKTHPKTYVPKTDGLWCKLGMSFGFAGTWKIVWKTNARHPVDAQRIIMNRFRLGFGVGLALAGASAYATDLNLAATADDAFTAFVSTSANSVGGSFASGNSWSTTFTGSTTLTPGVTNYLHIDAFDVAGAPSMFIAELGLSDADFWFDNNTQSALTGDAAWTASTVGFGGTATTIDNLGANGSSPWGSRSGISSSASFIWTPGTVADHRYFTLRINTSSVPEPASLAVIGFGAAILLRRRKSSKA